MNKTELLAELAVKFYKVGTVANADPSGQAVRQAEGVNWYLVGVYDRLDDTLERKNISIYVADEGKDTEQAFYAGTVPESRTEIANQPVPVAPVTDPNLN